MTDTTIRTYEILTRHGKFRIDVPEAWKVTYGPVIGAKGYDGAGNAFRVWESEKQQRALFADVISFRDLSLPMLREAVRKFGSEEWIADDGSYTGKKAGTVERRWVPADEIKDLPPEVPEIAEYDEPSYPSAKAMIGRVGRTR